ncbi:hypothetical protein ACHAWF_010455, partial [Thalassiosira exigua]
RSIPRPPSPRGAAFALFSTAAPRSFASSSSSSSSDERPPLPQSFARDPLLRGSRVLIANRGEISIRVARAARSLGATSVAVCAPEDRRSPHASFADEVVVLDRGNTAIAPYLDVEGLTRAAADGGADLVHPAAAERRPSAIVVSRRVAGLRFGKTTAAGRRRCERLDSQRAAEISIAGSFESRELSRAAATYRLVRTVRMAGVASLLRDGDGGDGRIEPFASRASKICEDEVDFDEARVAGNSPAIQISASLDTRPGYGFLSESAPFARSLADAGVVWVGPPPDVLQLFGDKIRARQLAVERGVPVVRGSGNLNSGEECRRALESGEVRLPAIMKAAYGGGGRGMRSGGRAKPGAVAGLGEERTPSERGANRRSRFDSPAPTRPARPDASIRRAPNAACERCRRRDGRTSHAVFAPDFGPRLRPPRLVSTRRRFELKARPRLSLTSAAKTGIVRDASQATSAFDSCRREARTAFGRDEVFLEEFWEDSKHLEVQILADGTKGAGAAVHLFERDCTVQHRHQKVIELAPARDIHPELRARLVECAVALARGCDYKGAGTVEFLVRGDLEKADAEFVFMEVNPRVQVEHTVTEEATGIDIVQAQLLIAGGRTLEDLGLTQDNIGLRQHSVQARITMMPGKGEVLEKYEEPSGDGVRCDTAGWYAGFAPNQMYDPLVGKLICSAEGVTPESFEKARKLMLRSLEGFNIEGVANNIDAVERIMTHPEFLANKVNTSFLADNPELLDPSKAKKGPPTTEHGSAKRLYSEERIRYELMPPMTGNILEVKKKAGDEVDVGEVVVVLSAMKIETEMVSPVKGVVSEINCKAGEQVSGNTIVAVLEGHEEIVVDATAGPSAPISSRGTEKRDGSLGVQLSDPSMDVWSGSDDFAPQHNLNDSGTALPIIRSIPEPQLNDGKAQERRRRNVALKEELSSKLEKVRLGGGKKAVEKHLGRGKMLPRDRIAAIIDPGSAFLEIGALAGGDGLYSSEGIEDLPAGGVVAGIGIVHGREVMIVANDATTKGGTYFPITVKKHLRAQQIAAENRLPCIYLVDSGGAYLRRQADVFPDRDHFGRIFFNQANMSAAGVPQLAVVLGSCTAGGAYVPAMSDETVIVNKNGTIFLAGPPLVKAATQEVVSAEDLGGAEVHTSISGVADHFAKDEPSALTKVRQIVGALPPDPQLLSTIPRNTSSFVEEPLYPLSDLLSIIPEDNRIPVDVRQILARVLDGSRFHEFKERFGKSMVCGFGKIHGLPVGVVANNGILFSSSSLKATHFIQLCVQRKVPILFVQNITGFMVGKEAENNGIAKDGAKLVTAVSCAPVPKITLIVGGSHGAGNYGMCGRAYDPRFLFTWPNSRISVMGGPQAAGVISTVKSDQIENETGTPLSPEEIAEIEAPLLEKYKREGSPYFATARLWDDGVIQVEDTRKVMGQALRVVSKNIDKDRHKRSTYGVFRT